MTALKVAGIIALLVAVATTLPTETRVVKKTIKRQSLKEEVKPVLTSKDAELILKEEAQEKENLSTTTTTTERLPVSSNTTDQKKVVTYILGQPGKGAIQSPAELLSPDRYEFYTFDDDGKIIKKLMNVEEIQRIIASSRDGVPIDAQHNTDYYQVLTVTPDVQSLPAVKINPNEPIFSIHDVIASVQNVLKSEINQKTTQLPPALTIVNEDIPSKNTENSDVPEIESVNVTSPFVAEKEQLVSTETVPILDKVEDQTIVPEVKVTAASTTPTTTTTTTTVTQSPSTTTNQRPTTTHKSTPTSTQPPTTLKTTVTTKKPVVTTKKAILATKKPQIASTTKITTTTKRPVTTTKIIPTTVERVAPSQATEVTNIGNPTMVQVLKISSSVSQSSSPISQLPAVTTVRTTTTTALKPEITVSTTTTESSSFRPIVVTEVNNNDIDILPSTTPAKTNLPPIVVPDETPLSILDGHPGLLSNNSFLDNAGFPESLLTIESQLFDNETDIKNASDLAQISNYTGAASALSQVQIPMNQALAESVSSVISQIANEISMSTLDFEDSFRTTTITPTTIDDFTTTEIPDSTILPESLLKTGDDLLVEENYTTTTSPKEENTVTTVLPPSIKPQNKPRPFSRPATEVPSTTVFDEFEATTITSNFETRTEPEELLVNIEKEVTTVSPPETTTLFEELLTTIQPEKDIEVENRLEVLGSGNNSSIEIIQEAETGRIPRPTQQPEEITTRPGSSITTSVNAELTSSTETNNVVSVASVTLSPINTKASPVSITVTSTTTELSSTVEPIESTSVKVPDATSSEATPDDDAENISISFMPMEIKTSAEPETTTNEGVENKTEENLESKNIPEEEIVEKSALAHKVVIAALSEEKVTPIAVAISKEPAVLHKQNYARPQTYVKPQKPVFIKPSKGKPQETKLEAKPFKPASKPGVKPSTSEEDQRPYETPLLSSPAALELDQAPDENLGLEATTIHLEPDVRDFVDLCNELAFSLWSSITHNGLSFVRSVVVSPFAVTSLLAMVFLGARGPTSGQMNDILKLDDVVTFNPHLVFRNVTESLVIARHPGVATAAFVRELYSDRSKGKLLDFYKERAQQFYDGHVEEVNYKAVGETLRRQTNHLIKRQTWGKVKDFLQGSTLMLRPPLAAFSANIFQADCSRASVKDRDGEMYFVVLPSNRLRRLVPIPAAVWRDDFLAGYEPNLDATAAAVGSVGGIVSTIFVMPGQQGLIAPGDSLARLEHHLLGSSYRRGHWERLMRSLLRRPGLELQVPRISHKSVVNVTASLQKMGLRDLFSAEKADLTGLNGLANDLHLSDMVQVNQFSTCGDDATNTQAHSEFYPAIPLSRREKSVDNVFAESFESLFAVSDFEDPSISALPFELRPRQARLPTARTEGRSPDPPRLRLDRPFLFFVRHNPTGFILHVGRFNPRLMH